MTTPTIDLSTCKPGDRVRLRNGSEARYCGKWGRHTHYMQYGYNQYLVINNNGKVMPIESPRDIVAIIGPSIWERVRRAWRRRKHA